MSMKIHNGKKQATSTRQKGKATHSFTARMSKGTVEFRLGTPSSRVIIAIAALLVLYRWVDAIIQKIDFMAIILR